MEIIDIAKCPLCAGSKLPPNNPMYFFWILAINYGLTIPLPETRYLYDVN